MVGLLAWTAEYGSMGGGGERTVVRIREQFRGADREYL